MRASRRPLPRLRLTGPRAALGCLGIGLAMLLVPLGSCGPALGAWAASPRPLPSDPSPAVDDAETRSDAQAVAQAQAALTAWHPAVSPAPRRVQPSTSTTTSTVSAADPREVAADQAAVDSAQREAAAAQHELDRLLAAQESSADPGAYDGQVAAAREELDRAVATLDEDRRALAVAKARTRTVTVTTTASPSPRQAASAVPASAPAVRADLTARLTEAKQVQAAHLAGRARVVRDWRTSHEQQVAQVSAYNAKVRSCAARAAVPASGGSGLVVLGVGLLLWRRATSLRGPR